MPRTIIDLLVLYAWVWPIRRRGEFDIPLDSIAREIRLFIVLLGLAASPITQPFHSHPLALSERLIAGAFFVWPNCAYYLTRWLRWLHLLPKPSPEYVRQIRQRMGEQIDPE